MIFLSGICVLIIVNSKVVRYFNFINLFFVYVKNDVLSNIVMKKDL